jgi:hypothetical protein
MRWHSHRLSSAVRTGGWMTSMHVIDACIACIACSGSTTATPMAGHDSNYSQWMQGYIGEVHTTKGQARYPSGTTFTPPSAAF